MKEQIWCVKGLQGLCFCMRMLTDVRESVCLCAEGWQGWSLEAALTQHQDYSGILGHRQIRPIGKTTGGKKAAEISLGGANEATHREERRLSDLTLRGSTLTRRKLDELSWRRRSLTVDTRREGGRDGGRVAGGARVIGSACQTLNIRVFAPVSVPFCGRDASLRDAVCLLFPHGGGRNKQTN